MIRYLLLYPKQKKSVTGDYNEYRKKKHTLTKDDLIARIKIEQFFAFLGLIPLFILIGMNFFINADVSSKMEGMVRTTATVTQLEPYVSYAHDDDGDTFYKVHVKYYIDDIPYETLSDVGDSSLESGDIIDFWYDPNDPYRTSAGTEGVNKSMTPIYIIICLFFGPVPLILIIDSIRCRVKLHKIAKNSC